MNSGIPGDEPLKNPVRQYQSYHKASYTFEQVVADLIDNSIDAGATEVEVLVQSQNLDPTPKEHRYLEGPEKLYCIVADNGKGIPEADMHGILSRGVDREYDEVELGSYGVGLKDSSLSQAYELTLFSKTVGSDAVAVRRLSSCLVKRFATERIFREEHLDGWMTETEGYKLARELMKDVQTGTVVLLEGMHKLELMIGDGDRRPYLNAIKERVVNYIRLVFQYYLEGVHVRRRDSTTAFKKIEVFYGDRQPENRLDPLDPFYREREFRDGTRKGTNHITKEFDTAVSGDFDAHPLRVTAWVLPHRLDYPMVREREDLLKKTKEGRRGEDGTVGGVGVVDLQGAYIYRNMRLVQFAPERDPWLGITTKNEHLNQMRLEIHLPPGRLIGSDRSYFDINTSKSTVNVHYSLLEALRRWANSPGQKFHYDDPRVLSLKERAMLRNGRDTWDKCRECESEQHTFSDCPVRPRCSICNSLQHTGARCPKRPACGACGSLDHLTDQHPPQPPPGGRTTPPGPGPGGARGGSPLIPPKRGTPGSSGATPGPNKSSVLRVSSISNGPLITTTEEDGHLCVQVNPGDPRFEELITGLERVRGGING